VIEPGGPPRRSPCIVCALRSGGASGDTQRIAAAGGLGRASVSPPRRNRNNADFYCPISRLIPPCLILTGPGASRAAAARSSAGSSRRRQISAASLALRLSPVLPDATRSMRRFEFFVMCTTRAAVPQGPAAAGADLAKRGPAAEACANNGFFGLYGGFQAFPLGLVAEIIEPPHIAPPKSDRPGRGLFRHSFRDGRHLPPRGAQHPKKLPKPVKTSTWLGARSFAEDSRIILAPPGYVDSAGVAGPRRRPARPTHPVSARVPLAWQWEAGRVARNASDQAAWLLGCPCRPETMFGLSSASPCIDAAVHAEQGHDQQGSRGGGCPCLRHDNREPRRSLGQSIPGQLAGPAEQRPPAGRGVRCLGPRPSPDGCRLGRSSAPRRARFA
jgi:hypothetical protein